MQITKMPLKIVLFLVVLLAGISAASAVDNPGQGQSLSVRFRAFSLNVGERVSGIKMKTSQGHIINATCLGGWTCERGENTVNCYNLHRSNAITRTSMLPEFLVRDIPNNVAQFSVEASVKILTGDNAEYLKELKESDLIIK